VNLHPSISESKTCQKRKSGEGLFCHTRFEVLKVMKVQVEAFRVVMLCNVVVRYKHFGGPCCLHLKGEVGGSKDGILLQHYTVSQPKRQLGFAIVNRLKDPITNVHFVSGITWLIFINCCYLKLFQFQELCGSLC
jgi:hypothetical protein